MVPEYVRIRIPQMIFRATDHGYNIRNLYNACDEFRDTHYMCLILIRTTEHAILGALIDEMPIMTTRNAFQGNVDSFVFSLHPKLQHFYSTAANQMHMLCDLDYIAIGAEGEGPALRFDDKLEHGKSYKSFTFNNEPLTCKTEGFKKNEFVVQDMEVYIV
jgi:hypothetical protein